MINITTTVIIIDNNGMHPLNSSSSSSSAESAMHCIIQRVTVARGQLGHLDRCATAISYHLSTQPSPPAKLDQVINY